MNPTFDRLVVILAKDYKLRPELLTADAQLEALGIDSLGVAELLWDIEDEFKITLPQEPVQLATIGEVVRFIDVLLAARIAGAPVADTSMDATLRTS